MKNFLILINREFSIFFKKIIFNLFFYFSFPILTYLFLVIIFSNLFDLTKGLIRNQDLLQFNAPGMEYSYYAVPAILFVCTSMIAFILPLIINIRDNKYLKYIYTTSLTPLSYFNALMICIILFSYIEFLISFLLVVQLSSIVFVSWTQIVYFFIIILPSILFFGTLGLLVSNFVKNHQETLIVSIFLFLFLGFGSFTFIPIDYFSETLNYVSFSKSYNLVFHLYDMFISELEDGKFFNLQTFIISILLSVIFYGVHIFLNYRKNKGVR